MPQSLNCIFAESVRVYQSGARNEQAKRFTDYLSSESVSQPWRLSMQKKNGHRQHSWDIGGERFPKTATRLYRSWKRQFWQLWTYMLQYASKASYPGQFSRYFAYYHLIKQTSVNQLIWKICWGCGTFDAYFNSLRLTFSIDAWKISYVAI